MKLTKIIRMCVILIFIFIATITLGEGKMSEKFSGILLRHEAKEVDFPPFEGAQFPLSHYYEPGNGLDWGGYNSAFPGARHVADDFCVPEGTDVFAPVSGIVRFARAWGYCPNWVHLTVIEALSFDKDEPICVILGHVNPIVDEENFVRKGDKIGTITSYAPCSSDHIHYGILDFPYKEEELTDAGYYPRIKGYVETSIWPGDYLDPVEFTLSQIFDYKYEKFWKKTALGEATDNLIVWYYNYDTNGRNCYVRHYTGGSACGGAGIVFDVLYGATEARVVMCDFAEEWFSLEGPMSDLKMPLTDEYELYSDNSNLIRQDFQGGYLIWSNVSGIQRRDYLYAAPGMFPDNQWDNLVSYRIADAYGRYVTSDSLGETQGFVTNVNGTSYYLQEFLNNNGYRSLSFYDSDNYKYNLGSLLGYIFRSDDIFSGISVPWNLIKDIARNRAYVLGEFHNSGAYEAFNGYDVLGPPVSDEVIIDFSIPLVNLTIYRAVLQFFAHGYLLHADFRNDSEDFCFLYEGVSDHDHQCQKAEKLSASTLEDWVAAHVRDRKPKVGESNDVPTCGKWPQ